MEGGGQKGGKVFKQMCVNESLNYSDRCMQFYFIFSMEDEGAQEWQHGSKKNVIVDRWTIRVCGWKVVFFHYEIV